MLDYRRDTDDTRPIVGNLPRAILTAVVVCGTLDILSAFFFGQIGGVGPGPILRYVASGPFGDSMHGGGWGAAAIGLAVHYALMTIMVVLFFLAASRVELIRRQWIASGLLYGILIYLVMNWIVVPARFGTMPKTELWSIGNALFSHLVCVGLPMGFIASRMIGRSPIGTPEIATEAA